MSVKESLNTKTLTLPNYLPREKSPEFWLQLFKCVLNPGTKKDHKGDLRILLALGKMQIYHEEKLNWDETYPSRKTICKWAGIAHESTVSRFVNSPEFALFGTKEGQRLGRRSNTYRLDPIALRFIRMFKKKGLLKDFDRKPDEWLESFTHKIDHWLMPIAQKSTDIDDFMNKLSIKKATKSHASSAPKVTLTLPSESLNPPTDNKTKPAWSAPPLLYTKIENMWVLGKDLGVPESDMYHFSFKESLSLTSYGLNELKSRTNQGWRAGSPVRALQKIINDEKQRRAQDANRRRKGL